MKKIAIAGAVLVVAVLVGFTGTTAILNSNILYNAQVKGSFLPDISPPIFGEDWYAGFQYTREWSAVNSKQKPCDDERSELQSAQKELEGAKKQLRYNIIPKNIPELKKLVAEAEKALSDANKKLNACKKKNGIK